MAALDKQFFMAVELDSSEAEEDTSLQQIFQNKAFVLSKDNANYIQRLSDELAAVEELAKRECQQQ